MRSISQSAGRAGVASQTKRAMPRRTSSDVRLRILTGSAIAIGPGKADLLHAIDETGSISAAARQMGMSYRRAWLLVDTMNQCFALPLVVTEKGGVDGGGSLLTETGRQVLGHYSELLRLASELFAPYLRAKRRSDNPRTPKRKRS